MANRIRIAVRREREEASRRLLPIMAPCHSAWASGVMRKFRPRAAALNWRPAEFIYAGTRRWQLLTQVMQVTKPLQQLFSLNLTVARTLKHQILLSGNPASAGREKPEHVSAPSARNSTIFVARWHPVELSSTNTPPLLPVRHMRKRVSPLPAESETTNGLALSFLRLQRIDIRNREVTELEVVPHEGDRIVRRLQRVETLPAFSPLEMSSGAANPGPRAGLVFQSPALKESLPNRHRASAGEGSAVVSPPALNFGAITDEVMRQIDRRLVATRERMGKM